MAGQADVYAIECEEKAVELIGKNREQGLAAGICMWFWKSAAGIRLPSCAGRCVYWRDEGESAGNFIHPF